jgi:hypothetical protein
MVQKHTSQHVTYNVSLHKKSDIEALNKTRDKPDIELTEARL